MSYMDQSWSTEARDELRAKIEQLSGDDMRLVLSTVISEANPDYLLSTLRGAISGATDMREKITALGIDEPTPDAALVAEMSAMRAEVEAAKASKQDLLTACKAAHEVLLTFDRLDLLKLDHEQQALNLVRAAIAKAHGEPR